MTKKLTPCPICTQPTSKKHVDEDCVTYLIESGLLATAPWFDRAVPHHEKWTDQERNFAEQLALQTIRWKKAELERPSDQ